MNCVEPLTYSALLLLYEAAREEVREREARIAALEAKLAHLCRLINVWQRRDEAAKGNNAANATEMQNLLREEANRTTEPS